MRRLLALVFLVSIAAPLPVAAGQITASTHFTGTLQLVVGESMTGATPDQYSLGNGLQNTTLVVYGDALSKVGATVSFDGVVLPDGEVSVAADAIRVVKAAANPAAAPLSAGSAKGPTANGTAVTRKIVVIIGYYTDLPGSPVTNAQAVTAMGGATGSVKSYFEAASRGRVTTTATVYGPWALGIAQCAGGASGVFGQSQNAMTNVANSHGVNLGSYDNIVLWTKVPCGVGWIGQGYVPGNYVQVLTDYAQWPGDEPALAADVIAHEMGHNLGLYHSQGLGCFDGSNNEIMVGTNCLYAGYADMYTTMGAAGDPSHSLMDSNRLRELGWLTAGEYSTVTGVGTYTLVPTYSATAGVRLLRINAPDPVAGGQTGAWTLELRSIMAGSAWDQFSGYSLAATTGVTIRYAEDKVGFAQSFLADSTPDGNKSSGVYYWDAPFQAGSVFTDPYGGVTVTVNSVSGSGASVTVGDTQAPSAPGSLSAGGIAGGGAQLTWTAATDNLGLANYRVYRDSTLIGSVSSSTLTYHDPVAAGVGGLHTYTVKAVDTAGLEGAGVSDDALLSTTPSAPTGVTGTPGNSAIMVSWTAPYDGGSAITAYNVTSTPGNFTCATTGSTSCIVSGLSNGVSYQFAVTATNTVGTGPASTLSAGVVPVDVPGRPTNANGTPGNGQVAVTWTAPVAMGGGTFSGYLVTASPGGQTCSAPTAAGCTVPSLANGTGYRFTVTASNTIGTGLPSDPSPALTPRTVPGKPTTVTALGTDGSAVVSWTAPATNGGATISSYTVSSSPAGHTCTTSGLTCTVSGLTNRSQYSFSVVATNIAGPGSASDATSLVTPLAGATYVPVVPNRLVDSRSGATRTGLSASLANNVPVSFQVTGRVPGDATKNIPANAVAVTGNLTVAGGSAKGYFALTPARPSGIPGVSTLNFPTSDNRANGVTVQLGSGGVLWVTYEGTGGNANVIFDVTGYFVPNSSGSTYTAVVPNRLVDSRAGATQTGLSASLTNNAPVSFQVTGRVAGDATKNIPANAVAVTGNLTVAGGSAKGYFALTPARPSGIPGVSTLNFPTGDNRANGVTVQLGSGGVLWVTYEGTGGNANVIFDVTGYFTPDASGATYVAVVPNRLVDSRAGATQTGIGHSLVSNAPASFQVTGRFASDATKNIPSSAVAVTGNLTVAGGSAKGYFALTPDQPSGIPGVSTLNFPTSDNRANGVTVQLGSGGILWVTYEGSGGDANAIFDVTGYFTM